MMGNLLTNPGLLGWLSLSLGLALGLSLGDVQAQDQPPAPAAAKADRPGRFTQDRFVVSFWVDPPADDQMDQRYREIAEANFNLVLGTDELSPEQAQRQLDLCQKYGLKALVRVPLGTLTGVASGATSDTLNASKLPDHPACWGYLLRDEPPAGDFASLGKVVRQVGELRPGKLGLINLLPTYGAFAMGTKTYDEYLSRFVDEVRPDVLCMDYYPIFRPGEKDGRDGYCENLEAMRKESLAAQIPFWNFFNVMPYGPHTDPTEDQLRWQIYASVAYGAKGVLYFCYYTPLSPEFPKGGAILLRDGRLSRHYAQAQRLNAELKAIGPTLMKLTSTGITRVTPEDDPAKVLAKSAVRNLGEVTPGDPKPNFLIGEFKHEDGRRAVVMQNYNFAYTAWPTVTFDAPDGIKGIVEVDKKTGAERPVLDDSPDSNGLQLSFDAGEGRLFLLPAQAE